jgi:hypothetical protein
MKVDRTCRPEAFERRCAINTCEVYGSTSEQPPNFRADIHFKSELSLDFMRFFDRAARRAAPRNRAVRLAFFNRSNLWITT